MELRDRKIVGAQARKRQEWQDEAWSYFDDVPEIKYAVWFEGNVMSKCRFYVAVRDADDPDADPVPIEDAEGIPPAIAEQAQAELQRLKGPLGGKSEIARELNMNLEIAGECYIVGFGERAGPDGQILPEEWDVKSVSEVDQQGGRYRIKAEPGDMKPRILDPSQDTLIRIWQRHPRYSLLADCAMRGVLSDCEGALLAGNAIKAEAKSQMSAGVLLLSNNLRADSRRDVDEGGEDDGEATDDDIGELLYDAATDPIQDPASAASVNPLILFGDPDDLKEAKHISWARSISAELPARLELHVQRIARGLNLPVEVTLGHQQTTFSNAEQVSEDTYTQHFEPRCILIADALSIGFLQPNLLDVQGAGQQEVIERIVVWFDPKGMLKPVDPITSSTEGISADLISSEAWRRVNGWSEDDAPKPEEQLMRLVLHLRTYDPGTTTALLELYGVPLDIPKSLPASGDTGSGSASTGKTAQAAALPGLTDRAGHAAANRVLELALERRRAGDDLDVPALLSQVLAEQLAPAQLAIAAPAATAALPPAVDIHRNVGYRLMTLDRNLRARLVTAGDAALDRALERAGGRLRSRALKSSALRPLTVDVPSRRLARTLGETVVRAVATDAELIGDDAWATLEEQFMTWGGQAQQRAIDIVNDVVGFSTAERAQLQVRQSTSLAESWSWLREQLDALATARLYGPDPHAPDVGEFDPTSNVPTGLIRQALSRAGGATGLTEEGSSPYVVLDHGQPPGGIGTGELMMSTITASDAEIDAYQWDYGDAYRATSFEPHLDLDGDIFSDFTSDLLASAGEFSDFYFPGDHNGCVCDIVPVIVRRGETDD